MAVWAGAHKVDCQVCNDQLKQVRGCKKDVPPYAIEEYTITRCPLSYLTALEGLYFGAYRQYEQGFLPNDGGWLDQPAKFIDTMTLISRLVAKFEKEKQDG